MKKLTGRIVNCKNCQKKVYRTPSLLKRAKFYSCSVHCSMVINNKNRIPWNKGLKGAQQAWNKGIENLAIRLEKHPFWKGGKNIMKSGYIRVRTEDKKYKLEHRIVMEEKIGRLLLGNEVVHHIDEDKKNNHPDNLMVFDNNSAHIKYHQQLTHQHD